MSPRSAAELWRIQRHRTSAMLTASDVAEIKALLIEGAKSRDIARAFEVTPGMVSHIKTGRQWSDVEPARGDAANAPKPKPRRPAPRDLGPTPEEIIAALRSGAKDQDT